MTTGYDFGAVSHTERDQPRRNRWLFGFAEDLVDLAAGVVDDADNAVLLLLVGGVRRLGDSAHQLADRAAEVHVSGLDTFGDLLPRRGLDLVGGRPALVGELEKLLAAFTFACDQQAFVDQQL